ncbi:hypothetical protein OG618_00595 [Kitasatospora sp. NBC_01246]|uniref:hypothetical protein n=1 Tax=Kitasatospora sp. NBC_01246 TaxID=2903570 RepID=UPI002E311C1D|nr:hypothetical protein [Kitasatospora sp. NBC_01246]
MASGEAAGHTWELLRGENDERVSCFEVEVDQAESSADCGTSVEGRAVQRGRPEVRRWIHGGLRHCQERACRGSRGARGAAEYVSTIGSPSASGPNDVVVLEAVDNPIGNISSKGPDGSEHSIKDTMDEVNSAGT